MHLVFRPTLGIPATSWTSKFAASHEDLQACFHTPSARGITWGHHVRGRQARLTPRRSQPGRLAPSGGRGRATWPDPIPGPSSPLDVALVREVVVEHLEAGGAFQVSKTHGVGWS